MKRPLTGGRRGCQITFRFKGSADFPMTMLWRKGDPLPAALERLHAIRPDPAAGRARRDAMLPQFEGIDQWIPRPIREALSAAVNDELITLERLVLADGEVTSLYAREHLADRWSPSSPLPRAGRAVVAGWERRGIDDSSTPYFAGFSWRYYTSIPRCLSRHGGTEWLEVVNPTRTRPLDALRIQPRNREFLARVTWP